MSKAGDVAETESFALNKCAHCSQPATLKCGGCQNVVYCEKSHQVLDWKNGHKTNCKCYRIETSPQLGRHLIAIRDIRKGEVILREKPIVVGPKTISFLTCLGCHKNLRPDPTSTPNTDVQRRFYMCSKCNWPLCGKACEANINHSKECEIMRNAKYKFKMASDGVSQKESSYCFITPLRMLLLRAADRNGYEKVMQLESHLDERMHTQLYSILRVNVAKFINNVLGLQEFDERAIMTAVGILDTNAFEIRVQQRDTVDGDANSDTKIRGLYTTASIMAHDCSPNTKHAFNSKDYQMIMIATRDIPKGESITVTYAQLLQGTMQRRSHLKATKFFDCICKRCSDPTEYGTYMGSMLCPMCHEFKIISYNPLDSAAQWHCEKCNYAVAGEKINMYNQMLMKEIHGIDKRRPKAFEEFIVRHNKTLHKWNTHVLQVKYALIQLYGNVTGFLISDISDELIQRKVDLCRELINVADLIEPGWSAFRGLLLLDLQGSLLMQITRNNDNGKLDAEAKRKQIMDLLEMLDEAENILKSDSAYKHRLDHHRKVMTVEIAKCQT